MNSNLPKFQTALEIDAVIDISANSPSSIPPLNNEVIELDIEGVAIPSPTIFCSERTVHARFDRESSSPELSPPVFSLHNARRRRSPSPSPSPRPLRRRLVEEDSETEPAQRRSPIPRRAAGRRGPHTKPSREAFRPPSPAADVPPSFPPAAVSSLHTSRSPSSNTGTGAHGNQHTLLPSSRPVTRHPPTEREVLIDWAQEVQKKAHHSN